MLGDPVRRRILELLADGELTSGAVCAVIQQEFGISQPAVSQHLRVLRESGFATVRPAGTRRDRRVAQRGVGATAGRGTLVIYLGSSALVKLAVTEPESKALRGWLAARAQTPGSAVTSPGWRWRGR